MLQVESMSSSSSSIVFYSIFIFQFHILNEVKGNEGTCVGVSHYPVIDSCHRTTGDMWLYRAYR